MTHTINIPHDTYLRLNKLAVVFNVSTIDVIDNLLNSLESTPVENNQNKQPVKKDYTTYLFNGEAYKKGQLVLAVITEYVRNNDNISFDDLSKIFPKDLQGSIGVFNKLEYVKSKYKDKKIKRHFMKDYQILQLSDSKIVVCTEWGAGVIGNIDAFLIHSKLIGFNIEPTNNF